MRIEAYFRQLYQTIDDCAIAQSHHVSHDKRGSHEAFIRGEIVFVDGSILHFREFVDVEMFIDRLMYVYQYTDAFGKFVFRYDNTGHHKKLNLPAYPHHKHDGSEDNVISSHAPNLLIVLEEIEGLLRFP